MSTAVTHSPANPAPPPRVPPPRDWSDQPLVIRLSVIVLAAFTAALIAGLWRHWRHDPELSHAFLTPLLFAYLLFEARGGTPRYLRPRRAAVATTVCVLLALGTLAASGLYAAALDWSHSLVVFGLTVTLALLWAAALATVASSASRFVPLNWTAATAVLLWLLSSPLPPGLYSRLTFTLQLAVTENVLHALHLLGIAASRHGNVIQLAATSVGVEEACSGIRSLLSCVYAAFLFTATLVRAPWARVLLLVAAGPLAIVMNFVRSFVLTLLANSGIEIAGTWHDVTGFAVLGITAAMLAGLAVVLERVDRHNRRQRVAHPARRPGPEPAAVVPDGPPVVLTPSRVNPARWSLLAGLLAVAAAAAFFLANTRPSVRQAMNPPDLATVLPAGGPGWQVRTATDLHQFAATLQTDQLAQRSYFRARAGGVDQITVYLAYWRPGQAPVSLVAAHTPDACWPGTGWVQVKTDAAREQLSAGGRILPPAESRLFTSDGAPQYVWFWHVFDGRPIPYRDPYSARELLKIAWRYGFEHDGDQLFVRVSSNRPWAEFAGDPLVADLFTRLRPFGL